MRDKLFVVHARAYIVVGKELMAKDLAEAVRKAQELKMVDFLPEELTLEDYDSFELTAIFT